MAGRNAAGEERRIDPAIKRGKAATLLHGKCQEIKAGERQRSRQGGKARDITQAEVIRPELVARTCQDPGKDLAGGLWRSRPTRILAAAKNPQKTVFDQRTGGPPIPRKSGTEKIPGRRRMRMCRVAQGNEDIDVEQMNHDRRG